MIAALGSTLPASVALVTTAPPQEGGTVVRQIKQWRGGVPLGPWDMAYMIHTSGSTGRPKGVMVPRQGLITYPSWAIRAYKVDSGSGSPVLTASAFDATLLSLWAPLVCGRPIQLPPENDALPVLSELLTRTPDFSLAQFAFRRHSC
ncbi:MAG: AMP-binding protein [Rhodospirillum sp.]|nr:AMP-binding protein [Rhodospirillum sp.]